ncbi:nitroimidazol reductase NimA-like FMN-containing flavoprotein (pyridoxamine 5'-phosphate oxidase superfamily) [Kibdelosporangium banguiense]|uniref:Nitroimidazol reductase NimA-like FMN-containing flavoprotein (Pyridoxamine 5'-phosphate oxidase superfamily) n=1 Tax=Kibdelosporangium banguiense TaxID=1365924 RepID=A0ABS4TL49_9PSEU|nr:pyridoxamine 5'-phosphate oxidase family protein [Kibdelosporangium banguiense]MBP2325135.1 nitroimidazol reductase NimA-like FMN-containing flavoprotein (pyridoxamine 5'-phosphate oxidase superfamily) [Kibdelosporangium banguiense]
MADSAGLEVLAEHECYQLLAKVPIGRIVFTDRALPAVQPVAFVLHENKVIIRTAARSRLAIAATDTVVAFEVDEFTDDRVRTGWSVVAVGQAKPITDTDDLAAVRQLGLRPWSAAAMDHYLAIGIEIISGRRLPTPS